MLVFGRKPLGVHDGTTWAHESTGRRRCGTGLALTHGLILAKIARKKELVKGRAGGKIGGISRVLNPGALPTRHCSE